MFKQKKEKLKFMSVVNKISKVLDEKNASTLNHQNNNNHHLKIHLKPFIKDNERAELQLMSKNLNYIYNSEIKDIERFFSIVNRKSE